VARPLRHDSLVSASEASSSSRAHRAPRSRSSFAPGASTRSLIRVVVGRVPPYPVRSRRASPRFCPREDFRVTRRGPRCGALKIRFCDEFDGGCGWIVDEFMRAVRHVLVAGAASVHRIRFSRRRGGSHSGPPGEGRVLHLLDRHNLDWRRSGEASSGRRITSYPRERAAGSSSSPIRMGAGGRTSALWLARSTCDSSAAMRSTVDYFSPATTARGSSAPSSTASAQQLGVWSPRPILGGHGEGVLRQRRCGSPRSGSSRRGGGSPSGCQRLGGAWRARPTSAAKQMPMASAPPSFVEEKWFSGFRRSRAA